MSMKKILLTSTGYPNGLGFIKNVVDVHCDDVTEVGKIENDDKICLTNEQAIYINDEAFIIE